MLVDVLLAVGCAMMMNGKVEIVFSCRRKRKRTLPEVFLKSCPENCFSHEKKEKLFFLLNGSTISLFFCHHNYFNYSYLNVCVCCARRQI